MPSTETIFKPFVTVDSTKFQELQGLEKQISEEKTLTAAERADVIHAYDYLFGSESQSKAMVAEIKKFTLGQAALLAKMLEEQEEELVNKELFIKKLQAVLTYSNENVMYAFLMRKGCYSFIKKAVKTYPKDLVTAKTTEELKAFFAKEPNGNPYKDMSLFEQFVFKNQIATKSKEIIANNPDLSEEEIEELKSTPTIDEMLEYLSEYVFKDAKTLEEAALTLVQFAEWGPKRSLSAKFREIEEQNKKVEELRTLNTILDSRFATEEAQKDEKVTLKAGDTAFETLKKLKKEGYFVGIEAETGLIDDKGNDLLQGDSITLTKQQYESIKKHNDTKIDTLGRISTLLSHKIQKDVNDYSMIMTIASYILKTLHEAKRVIARHIAG